MSFLNTTANLYHVTALPRATTLPDALAIVHNHDFLIHLDPELASYETQPSPPDAPNTKIYKVTDHMHTLPKGLWDTTVTFESQITNTELGVEWVIKAPLGLVQRTTWRVLDRATVEKERAGKAGTDAAEQLDKDAELFLVEDVEIAASRLLVGTVKSKCEGNWKGIHKKFVDKLEGGEAKA